MAVVTIEGSSVTPSTRLAPGERRTGDENDPTIAMLVRGGFANVVDRETGEPEPAPLPEPVPVPARNASREDWAEFVALLDDSPTYTEGKSRDELIAAYDEWLQTHDQPAVDPED